MIYQVALLDGTTGKGRIVTVIANTHPEARARVERDLGIEGYDGLYEYVGSRAMPPEEQPIDHAA